MSMNISAVVHKRSPMHTSSHPRAVRAHRRALSSLSSGLEIKDQTKTWSYDINIVWFTWWVLLTKWTLPFTDGMLSVYTPLVITEHFSNGQDVFVNGLFIPECLHEEALRCYHHTSSIKLFSEFFGQSMLADIKGVNASRPFRRRSSGFVPCCSMYFFISWSIQDCFHSGYQLLDRNCWDEFI